MPTLTAIVTVSNVFNWIEKNAAFVQNICEQVQSRIRNIQLHHGINVSLYK